MVKINKLAMIFAVCLCVALTMAVYVAVRIWFEGVLSVAVASRFFWAALAIDLLVVLIVSMFFVKFRDEGKIPIFNDLRKNNVFVKASISPEFKLTTLVDPETGESMIITGVPEDLPNTFMIENDGKVRDLTK